MQLEFDEYAIGIIPACAGSTGFFCLWLRRRRDHPRMRGEHGLMSSSNFATKGSSPHARGAHERPHLIESFVGIIPACAGSTCWRGSARRSRGDHPRMRGEHALDMARALDMGGSSPHARGAHA